MADVRLTATNPEDSSVVPVACDAAGRLLLEEPQVIEGPPGPPGEQGPPGQDGDPFSGNFAGDVTFGGGAEFAGMVESGPFSNAGFTRTYGNVGNATVLGFAVDDVNGRKATIWTDGSSEFAGGRAIIDATSTKAQIKLENFDASTNGQGVVIDGGGSVKVQRPATSGNADVFRGYVGSVKTVEIKADGSVTFAGNKAGFTAEGYLWCTTRRGDTVILDATSNGLASWVEYTPTTRLEDIRDKLDANRGDTGEMPADTP